MTPTRTPVPGLSPLVLLLLCWGLTGIGAALTLTHLDTLDLVQTFMRREGISPTVFEGTGLTWIHFGIIAYIVGDGAARFSRTTKRTAAHTLNFNRTAQMTFVANLILLGVTALWILTSAAKTGGLSALASAAYNDSLTTRDFLLSNKLFTGMRLFYAALPATGCLAAALLATGQLRRRARRLMWITLILNTAALIVLPLVMSQRLLLLQLLLSAYFAACIVRGRVFGLHWIALAAVLFLTLWVGREAITNPIVDRPATDIAVQKLAFYLVNDMFNAFAPLTRPIYHTNGGLLFEGVMFLTFTEGYFLHVLAPRLAALDPVIGGGEFPFFTAAYVDFGIKGGLPFIALCGFVLRRIFVRATRNFGWAVVYAQIGAALMFSSHSVYFTHQNFFFSAALIMLVVHLSLKRRPGPA
ncbi:O-antigen polymerase [Tateyamaria sp. SN6-1]|uniref:O-antigen polymerase n=1 Tax=Tateyamaria sp. SN6-1 TaxID=3092148 RepID=UPI0039F484B2